VADETSHPQSGTKQGIGTWQLAALAFFTVSGGPYGLEPLVGALGLLPSIFLLIFTPLFYAVPIALAVAELGSMMPENGGYYAWIKRGLGPFWAVQAGVWIVVFAVVDLAIYPALFINYLAYFLPVLGADAGHPILRWIICIALVGVALWLNLRGTNQVAKSAMVGTFLVTSPFFCLALAAMFSKGDWQTVWHAAAKSTFNPASLSLGLATALWNFSGWDNVSTYANDVRDPQHTFPRGLALSVGFVTLCYLSSVVFGYKCCPDLSAWQEATGFPVIGQAAAGPILGIFMAILAVFTSFMLLVAQFLYVPRIPYMLARDGYLPKSLAVSRYGDTPRSALIATAVVTSIMAAMPFGKLVVIDVLLYGLTLALELVALLRLRVTHPDQARPFRIPLPLPLLTLMCICPIFLIGLVGWQSWKDDPSSIQLLVVVAALLIGPLLYYYGHARESKG
jgi:amino acid transporter